MKSRIADTVLPKLSVPHELDDDLQLRDTFLRVLGRPEKLRLLPGNVSLAAHQHRGQHDSQCADQAQQRCEIHP